MKQSTLSSDYELWERELVAPDAPDSVPMYRWERAAIVGSWIVCWILLIVAVGQLFA